MPKDGAKQDVVHIEWSAQRWQLVGLSVVLFLDLIAAALQYLVLNNYLDDNWDPEDFFGHLFDFNS
jgi:hypothetical protein